MDGDSPIIKLNSVCDLHTARYGAGMGVSMIGVCTDPDSPSYLEVSEFQEIFGWVAGPVIVGEIKVWPYAEGYAFDMIEVSNLELAKQLPEDIPLILRVDMEQPISSEWLYFSQRFEYVLVHKQSGMVIEDFEKVRGWSAQNRTILCCPDAYRLYRELGCVGFALNSYSIDAIAEILQNFES